MTWIPVTERLPESNRDVLIYNSWKFMNVAYFAPGAQEWKDCKHGRIVGVTHWMELPPPPTAMATT